MHKFLAKIKSDNSDTKILKIIRDFSHEPIGAIKEKMTHHMAVLETEYLNLERLKSFKKTVEEITELGGELQLFLDDEKVMKLLPGNNLIKWQGQTALFDRE